MTDLSKSIPLEKVEALLAAERERCAKVADTLWVHATDTDGRLALEEAAAAIRSLAPQTMGGEE